MELLPRARDDLDLVRGPKISPLAYSCLSSDERSNARYSAGVSPLRTTASPMSLPYDRHRNASRPASHGSADRLNPSTTPAGT